ncbi:MAG: hypothetical protein K0U78_17635 [Actinomycetia bacterium]|nr:hypothetical protein [Actinomycetes bacterium]
MAHRLHRTGDECTCARFGDDSQEAQRRFNPVAFSMLTLGPLTPEPGLHDLVNLCNPIPAVREMMNEPPRNVRV